MTIDRGDFGPFKRSLNTELYGYQLVEDPTGRYPDHAVERFEVRSGDCAENRGWSDCRTDRERSEVTERPATNNEAVTYWYGWNFYVPPDWPNVFPTKTVLGQFHQIDSHPVWMFLQQKGGLYLDDQSAGFSARKILLIPEERFSGRWHTIEVQVTWATDETGLLKVFVDSRLQFEHHGRTMSKDAVYFKYGVYRSFVSRYKTAKGVDSVPTQIAYFANVRRSSSRSGLQSR